MKYKEMPTKEVLRQLFSYDPEEGVLRWAISPGNGSTIGDVAGNLTPAGYLRLAIKHDKFMAHRIAFKFHTGREPIGMLDHKNGVKTDNRFDNFREASRGQNVANAKLSKSNTSGAKGVSFYRDQSGRGYWYAIWSVNSKPRRKTFPGTAEGRIDAEEFIKAKRRELYGAFANDGGHRDAPV